MEIIYEDVEVLVAVKPAGVESEEARGLAPDMVNLVRKHLAGAGKGMPYVGLIRRLDKPVAGLMLFGKTPAAAAALSKELQDGEALPRADTRKAGGKERKLYGLDFAG